MCPTSWRLSRFLATPLIETGRDSCTTGEGTHLPRVGAFPNPTCPRLRRREEETEFTNVVEVFANRRTSPVNAVDQLQDVEIGHGLAADFTAVVGGVDRVEDIQVPELVVRAAKASHDGREVRD